jgi:hypothetical protein
MSSTKLFALVLIFLGCAALAYQAFTYTTNHKVVDFGPLQISKEKTSTIPLPPIVGGLVLAGGLALLLVGGKKVGA